MHLVHGSPGGIGQDGLDPLARVHIDGLGPARLPVDVRQWREHVAPAKVVVVCADMNDGGRRFSVRHWKFWKFSDIPRKQIVEENSKNLS